MTKWEMVKWMGLPFIILYKILMPIIKNDSKISTLTSSIQKEPAETAGSYNCPRLIQRNYYCSAMFTTLSTQ